MVFEALVWLSRQTKDGAVKISYSKLAEFSLCGDRTTAFRSVKHLISAGLVLQNATGVLQIATESVQNATISKEERTKEENINKKEVCLKSDTQHTTFSSFFKIFSPNGEYKSYEKACKKIWETMPQDWRKLATERAPEYSAERNPLYFLQDEDFLKVGKPEQKAAPSWLDHEQQYQLLQGGAELVFCRRPDGKGFGTVTKADAERFQLLKVRDVTLNY